MFRPRRRTARGQSLVEMALILPFMLASVIASLFSHRLHPESMNTLRLARLGVRRTPATPQAPLVDAPPQ